MSRRNTGNPHLIRDCVLAVTASAISIGALSFFLASWYLGTWKPFEEGQNLPWEALGRLAIPLTALFAAIVGAVIAGHGQSAKLRELKNSEDANVTERFTSALDQLAHENENVRIGGIYALERIGHDSERDRKTIVSILRANLIRPEPKSTYALVTSLSGPRPRPDRTKEVEAALVIALMRLRRRGERDELASYLMGGVSVEGADLSGAFLASSQFTGVYLAETSFRGSDCSGALFSGTIIYRADFRQAMLQGAQFQRADLTEANFHGADLRKVDFEGASLTGADFRGAKIRGAKLSLKQLKQLKMNKWEAKARGVVVTEPAPRKPASEPNPVVEPIESRSSTEGQPAPR